MSGQDRINAQLAFLAEADRLKTVLRASPVSGARRENSAEHSWHLALYALVLADQAPKDVSIDRVIRMLLLHDLVEIDTGDAPIHAKGPAGHGSDQLLAAETAAARRIFGLLPPDQAATFRALWDEFEAAETPDAIFAKALDRVQPVMLNIAAGGGTWRDYDVTLDQLDQRVGRPIARAAPRLWAHVRALARPFFAKSAD